MACATSIRDLASCFSSWRTRIGGLHQEPVGLYLIEAAERDGKLQPGGTLMRRPAEHRTGAALWRLRRAIGLLLVVPDKMSQEKIFP